MSSNSGSKAFVTGGTGFVGSHLVEALVERGASVTALIRSSPKWLEGLPVNYVTGDLFDDPALRKGMRGADVVYHIAGLTRAPTQEELDRVNVVGTEHVLCAAEEEGVPRIVITSSQAAAGPSREEPLTETAPLRPVSMYGASKARMEEIVRGKYSELSATIVRPPAVYGPREADIYTVIRTAHKWRLFPIVGDADEPRVDLVYVYDLVDGLMRGAMDPKAAGQTYFMGGPRAYSWCEVHEAMTSALGHGALKIPVPPGVVGPAGALFETVGGWFGAYPPFNREMAIEAVEPWVSSSEKAGKELGYEPKTDLEKGMEQTIAWYRQAGWL